MIRLFLYSLRNRWLEYLAAAAVVAVVVAALVVQGSLATSAEGRVHDLAHNLGKNMLVVPAETDLGKFYALEYGAATVPDTYPAKVLGSALAQHIGVIQSRLYGNVDADGSALVLAGQPDLFPASITVAGKGASPAVLGDSAAQRLGLGPNATFELGGSEMTVVHIAESLPNGFDMAVFTKLVTAQEILQKPGALNAMLMAGCWCSIDVPALARQVENELPGTKAITVAGVLESQAGTIATVKRYSEVVFGVALFLIAGITAVLIAAQVRRQMREIGLLLAVGASPSAITMIFVAQAALVGASGAIAGLLLGGPLTRFVANRMIGSPLPASTDVFAPVLIVTVLVSVVAALVPARGAASLDPTEVLRGI